MRTYVRVFTPEEAYDIVVNRNDNYRKLKEAKALEYAKMMKSGKWCEENGETIKFKTNGMLSDGQHRLWAVYKSGVTLKFLVVDDVPEEATETIDMGLKRSSEDAIRYRLRDTDKEMCPGAFSTTKQVMVLRKNGKANSQCPYTISLTEIDIREEFLSDVDGYNEAAAFGKKVKKDTKTIKQNEAGSMYYYLVHDFGINPWYVKDYFNKLSSAARNEKSIFNTTITNLSQGGLTSAKRYDELIWGWNSYIRGCGKKRCQYSGWFDKPTDKAFFETDDELDDLLLSEEDASSPVVREISLI